LVHPREGCAREAESRRTQRAWMVEKPQVVQSEAQVEEDARADSIWARLEREFALGAGIGSGRLLLPRHSRDRWMEMIRWMACGPDRCEILLMVRTVRKFLLVDGT